EPLRLTNVPQAREKETDRIAVMARVINDLGGRAGELSDGLVVHPARLKGGTVDSAGDHRVAMAAAVAGLCADGPVTVTNAGVADITFPGFYELLASAGARVEAS
ncbi:MAG: 3-phosphoshikimate 1-carboxyvinyltransferase, partial [Spirochaetota bacterium]